MTPPGPPPHSEDRALIQSFAKRYGIERQVAPMVDDVLLVMARLEAVERAIGMNAISRMPDVINPSVSAPPWEKVRQDLQVQIDDVEARVTTLEGSVATLQSDVAALQQDMSDVQSDIADLQSAMDDLEQRVSDLEGS